MSESRVVNARVIKRGNGYSWRILLSCGHECLKPKFRYSIRSLPKELECSVCSGLETLPKFNVPKTPRQYSAKLICPTCGWETWSTHSMKYHIEMGHKLRGCGCGSARINIKIPCEPLRNGQNTRSHYCCPKCRTVVHGTESGEVISSDNDSSQRVLGILDSVYSSGKETKR